MAPEAAGEEMGKPAVPAIRVQEGMTIQQPEKASRTGLGNLCDTFNHRARQEATS
jgi:hypothetical protein